MFLQETHGDDIEIRDLLFHELKAFRVFVSRHPDRSTGGVVTLVRNEFARNFDNHQCTTMVQGRALKVTMSCRSGTVILYNIHNYNISRADSSLLADCMITDSEMSVADPLGHSVLVGGDFNFLPLDELPFSVARPTLHHSSGHRTSNYYHRHDPLRRALERFTEAQ